MTKTVQQQPSSDELRALIAKATDDDLSDDGRYFHDSCDDLTKCGHGDTGEYQHSADGKLVEWLWNHRHDIAKGLNELDIQLARIGELEAALGELIVAITFADPPKLFNDVLCHEARIPVEFVTRARALLTPKAPEVSNG